MESIIMRKHGTHQPKAVISLFLFLASFLFTSNALAASAQEIDAKVDATLLFTSNALAASAQEIDAKVDATLKIFKVQVPGAAQYLSVAKGVLVFPSVFRAGIGIGGEYGEGAMRINGQTVEYWSTASASIGFTFGAQSKSLVLIFLDEAELIKFRHSEGWRAGIDGSVAFVEWGSSENIDTINTKDPILGFAFGNKGLMANIALEGSKFILLNKE
jgi:lipid-binding SYLF domain-containing protein